MKRLHVLLFIPLVLLGTACERHHAAELSQIEESPEQGASEAKPGETEKPTDQKLKTAPDAPGPKYFGH